MDKIIKWITWALMIIGVVLTVYVFAADGNDSSVNLLIYWAYVMVVLAICSILFGIFRDCLVNKKALVRIGIVLCGAVVLIGLAYVLAPGSPAIGYTGEPVSDGTLKLTDAVLNLTYFSIAAAILAIITSAVVDAVKK